ncbi:hypothetical protein M9H77_16918 [Catharanthus roseus]|uniref:Uncharacterized protein n=1 Tax=Catharanthus roseus TaxID=4058 RepID=A0ACC0B344_CATRO|nr:hypothetical protein M9H77_16918 [Catharanthus roseus]
MKDGLIVELNNEGFNPIEETSPNKGNVNNEDSGKKPQVGVEISNCDIVGDPGLHKSIHSHLYEIIDELRRRSSFDRAQSVISRFSTTFALISPALIEFFYLGSATTHDKKILKAMR